MQEIRAAVDAFWADLKKGCNNIIRAPLKTP